MSLFKIPTTTDWRELHSSIAGSKVISGRYIAGFHEILLEYMDIVINHIEKYPTFSGLNGEREITFREIYEVNIRRIGSELQQYDIPKGLINDLSELIFWGSIQLPELFLLMKDPMVNEIYVNGEKIPIYIFHERYGHLATNLTVSREGLNAFVRILELVYGEGLQALGGNIEVEIETLTEKYRVVVDTYPLTHGDYNLVIRRMKKVFYDIEILSKTGFLSNNHRLILERVARKAGSILIVGEPNSGKTTLLNAYMKMLPPKLRKIYFEEARELEDMRDSGNHQVFYRLSSISKEGFRESQTLFTLRRSPEYVVLGEVISDKDIEILLDTLLLGYRLAATMHAADIDSLWERFRRAYGENFIVAVRNIDLVIHTARDIFRNVRYIDGIYTVDREGRPREIQDRHVTNLKIR